MKSINVKHLTVDSTTVTVTTVEITVSNSYPLLLFNCSLMSRRFKGIYIGRGVEDNKERVYTMELTKERCGQIAQIGDMLEYIITNGSQEDINTVYTWLISIVRWIQCTKGGV